MEKATNTTRESCAQKFEELFRRHQGNRDPQEMEEEAVLMTC